MKNVTVIILMGVEMWRSLLNDPGPDPDFHKNWDVSCAVESYFHQKEGADNL